VRRADSKIREFGGGDVGDERAAILDAGRKPVKMYAHEETIKQFDYRQYLFARKATVSCCACPCTPTGLRSTRASVMGNAGVATRGAAVLEPGCCPGGLVRLAQRMEARSRCMGLRHRNLGCVLFLLYWSEQLLFGLGRASSVAERAHAFILEFSREMSLRQVSLKGRPWPPESPPTGTRSSFSVPRPKRFLPFIRWQAQRGGACSFVAAFPRAVPART
jgi:hypothetical protein